MVVSFSKKLRVKNIVLGILLFSLTVGSIFALKDLIFIDGGLIGLINQKYRGYKVKGSVMSGVINTGQYGITTTNRLFAQVKEFNICKVVSTTSTNPLFIPTKTLAEWSGFINKKPGTVTLASCGCYRDDDCNTGETCAGEGPSKSSYCAGTYTSTSNYCKKNSNGFGCWLNDQQIVGPTYVDCANANGIYGFWFDSTFYNILTACSYYSDNPDYWYNCAPCASVTNSTECGQYSNLCTWISGGTSSSCSAFDTNQVSCQGTAGCTWHPAEPATPGVCTTLLPDEPLLCGGGCSATSLDTFIGSIHRVEGTPPSNLDSTCSCFGVGQTLYIYSVSNILNCNPDLLNNWEVEAICIGGDTRSFPNGVYGYTYPCVQNITDPNQTNVCTPTCPNGGCRAEDMGMCFYDGQSGYCPSGTNDGLKCVDGVWTNPVGIGYCI